MVLTGVCTSGGCSEKAATVGDGCKDGKDRFKECILNRACHPDDRHLLGMRWNDRVFVDAVLPFGLRSAPKIFNAIADAVE